MEKGDYRRALRECQPLAEQGVPEAQLILGLLYSDGLGVRVDAAKAVSFFRLAADQGLAYAQYGLGDSYFIGLGVAEDYAEAMNWYERAANQGHPQAQFSLARMYRAGSGRAQSLVLAYKWCTVLTTNPVAVNVDSARCDRISPEMSQGDVDEARELASKFVPRQERASHPAFRTVP